MKQHTILIVDDEADILDLLEYNLLKGGHKILRAPDGEVAIQMAKKWLPDLILLDIMMPGKDGIETCQQIRQLPELKKSVVAFLTARGEEFVEVAAFEAGGDDFIRKPILPRALRSRVEALLRRKPGKEGKGGPLKIHDLLIDHDAHLVYRKKKPISLTRKEFNLLQLLASQPGKVFGREDILKSVWTQSEVTHRTIDVHILKLRQKIGGDYIQTLNGVGYKFLAPYMSGNRQDL